MQRNVGGTWQTDSSSWVNIDGSFTVTFGLYYTGVQSYRINIPATTSFGAKTARR